MLRRLPLLASLAIEVASAVGAEHPARLVAGYLPEATPESQGADSAKIAGWAKAMDSLGDIHGFVLLRHGRLIAEGYWSPYPSKGRHSLNGLDGVVAAGLVGADWSMSGRRDLPTGELLDALTARNADKATEEAAKIRSLAGRVCAGMYYEQAVARLFTKHLGFDYWESPKRPGDGTGRKTRARDMALIGQLHLWKGDWFGRRVWSEEWAKQYYRFFRRPSGMFAAFGGRGQILAVSPGADAVLMVNADAADPERIAALAETLLASAFADGPIPENPAAKSALDSLCGSLRLPGVEGAAKPSAAIGIAYDLPANRYGLRQFRLSEKADGCSLELDTDGRAQRLDLRSEPGGTRAEFFFADNGGESSFVTGSYRISASGGWIAPRKYLARLYLTETSERFDWMIDFADLDRPVFTVARGAGLDAPTVLAGKPAGRIGGVARVQPRAEIVWTRPIRKSGYIGWPTVMRRRNGELIASYSGNREKHVCPYGREEFVRSRDGGETWSDKPEIFHNSIIDDRDSGITELANGDLLAAWFSSTCFAGDYPKAYSKLPRRLVDAARGFWTRRSSDGGRTWERPVPHLSSSPHGAVQLKDGRVIIAGCRWTREDVWNPAHCADREKCLLIEESMDNGRSWHVLSRIRPKPPFRADEDTDEPYPVETDDGRILVFCRSSGRKVMTQVESSDGGRTWSEMRETPIAGYPPHFLKLPGGKILCSYVDRSTCHEMAVVSDDHGRTWDVENRIFLSKGPKTDMGYPSTVRNDDGTLLTVYYQPEKADEPPCLMATKWKLAK